MIAGSDGEGVLWFCKMRKEDISLRCVEPPLGLRINSGDHGASPMAGDGGRDDRGDVGVEDTCPSAGSSSERGDEAPEDAVAISTGDDDLPPATDFPGFFVILAPERCHDLPAHPR